MLKQGTLLFIIDKYCLVDFSHITYLEFVCVFSSYYINGKELCGRNVSYKVLTLKTDEY